MDIEKLMLAKKMLDDADVPLEGRELWFTIRWHKKYRQRKKYNSGWVRLFGKRIIKRNCNGTIREPI